MDEFLHLLVPSLVHVLKIWRVKSPGTMDMKMVPSLFLIEHRVSFQLCSSIPLGWS